MYTLWNVFLISTSLKLQIFTFLSVTIQIGKFFITNLTISQAMLFIMERLTAVTTGSPLPQAQLHHTPEQRSE